MKHYLALTKPRITWLILMSTGIGYFCGRPDAVQWWNLFHCLLGTALIASGTATLNQWYERDADAKMNRTRLRPLPGGLIRPWQALAFGISLSILGFAELYLGANPLSAWLGLFTLVTYLFAYTPLKRVTWWSTTVGAIPGAMPPLIGFAAAANTLTPEAWALYAILFCWQFPHFYAIAWMYRDDYAKAGIRMLPVVKPDGEETSRQILLFSLILIPVSLVPSLLSATGWIYLVGASVLGALYLLSGIHVSRERTLVRARGVLKTSVLYLPLLYLLLLIDFRL
jgi:protoheme IX farnesyltransferase